MRRPRKLPRPVDYEGAPPVVPQVALDLMPAAALRAWARFHQAIANSLVCEAELRERSEIEARARRDRREGLRGTFRLIETMRDQGHDLDGALNLVALRLGADLAQVRAHYDLGAKAAGQLKRERRNREIARLARLGLTNAEISARLDPPLHPKHVAKILRRALAAPDNAPAPALRVAAE